MKITHNEAMKEIREIARANGLVFKRQNATYNGAQLYQFTSRITGAVVINSMTFWNAYENSVNGYVDSHSVN